MYFESTISIISDALHSIDNEQFRHLLEDCQQVLESGHKIIATGLGKNVPICEKFVGTMLSLGLEAGFLHTNSAIHGDMGMVRSGDLVLILTKSGSTSESLYLTELLQKREGVVLWLISFNRNGILTSILDKTLFIELEHEGDQWNVMPNNSSTVYLIVLQAIAQELAQRMHISLQDFKQNHPGGAIGKLLSEKQ